jgi:hypothetical protein
MHNMPDKMSTERMVVLHGARLYIINPDDLRATPNYRYCRPDAPKYEWDTRLNVWRKMPRTGGEMMPIVEAVEHGT